MSTKIAIGSSLAIVLGGVVAAFVHFFAGVPGDPEGVFAALGFGAPFIGLGLLGLLGSLRGNDELVIVAGIVVIPMSLITFILIPLVIPAVGLIQVVGQCNNLSQRRFGISALLVLPLAITLGILIFHQDPATWSSPQGGGSSSNIVTTAEASLTIATASIVVFLAATWRRIATKSPQIQHSAVG